MKPVPVLIATAGLALLVACSGHPSSAGPGTATTAGGTPGASSAGGSPSAVAYSRCMRADGVPDFPDPVGSGAIPKTGAQALGVSSSRFQAARSACQHLLPDAASSEQQARQCLEAGDCPQAVVQQMLTADRAFARCMRSHGVPNWPDPSIGAAGGPVFNLVPVGITHSQTHSPPVSGKIGECERLDPAPVGLESN